MTHGGANKDTYEKTGTPGVISIKRRDDTGTIVIVVRTEHSNSPRYPYKYFTQCLSHRTKKGWSTRSKGIKGARVPSTWCNGCETLKAEQQPANEAEN